MKSYNVILASASPRRKELISKIKCIKNVEIVLAQVNEDYGNIISVEEIVVALAQRKAEAVAVKTGGLVLGADTLVSLNGHILGKPATKEAAADMFKMLCGATHLVTTGVCFVKNDKIIKGFEKTCVTFNAFNEEIVYNYIATGKPFDKAGGYGIQDDELKPLIKNVDGDLSNVIGLPLTLTEKLLKENF